MSASTATPHSAPTTAERLEHCRQACLEALDRQDWLTAVQRQAELKRLVEDAADSRSDLRQDLWELYSGVMNATLARLHSVLISTAEHPPQPLPRAQLCWQMYVLLQDHHSLPITIPEWLPVLEQQLIQDGAWFWRELIGERPEAAGRALALYERLAELLDPCPDWVRYFCEELWANQPVQEPAAQPATINADPLSIAEQVHGWLDSHGGQQQALRLGLVYVPSQSTVSRDPRRLDLNLAPLLDGREPEELEAAMAAFLHPLQELGHGTPLEVREPSSYLYESLGYLWRLGEELGLEVFPQLTHAAAAWNRLTGPGCLGGKLLPSALPPLQVAEHGLMLQLDATELAVLQSRVFDPEALEPALAVLRREHLNEAFWREQDGDWWFRPTKAVDNLRRFQRDAGFYAGSAAPLESLECWSRGALACLTEGAVWSETAGWPSDFSASWFFLPIAQAICSGTGRLPDLFQGPDPADLYPLMAGKEALYVGPLSEEVEHQHRSGSSFQLFHDRSIEPYGLRTLAPPSSFHPSRPHGSFEQSLEVLLEQVDRLHRQRPFDLLLVAAGAYRLPLCQEVRRRYGATCIAPGPRLHQLFGVELPGDPAWRKTQRRDEHWRSLQSARSGSGDVVPEPELRPVRMGTVEQIEVPLTGADRLELCCEETLRALEMEDWAGVVARQEEAKRLIDALPQHDLSLWQEAVQRYGEVMNAVVARLHGVLNAKADSPLPPLPRARLCWQLLQLLQQHHNLPVESPDWLWVLEAHLVQDGAFYWKEMIGERPEAAARSLTLFERLNELLDPVPDWVGVYLVELQGQQPRGETLAR